jgi:hypothetical protein
LAVKLPKYKRGLRMEALLQIGDLSKNIPFVRRSPVRDELLGDRSISPERTTVMSSW